MTKYRDNIAAIKLLKTLESERRRATAAEQKVLARYVGWGGIPNAFRNSITQQVSNGWESEVAELESLLTPKELRAAAASTRNAHFTAKEVVDFMWQGVKKMGFSGGMVLEPSVGTGNFIGLMPKDVSGKSFVTGIELDSLTSRIAGLLYPKSSIINSGFQQAALPDNRFTLAIGNPPFGAESLRFKFKPELNGASIHNQFFLGSMDALEPGGIMAMVVSRYLMDSKDASTREKLAIDAELMGAVRLPGSAFKGNALTEVVTDVLFFRKRQPAEAMELRDAYANRGRKVKSKEMAEHAAAQDKLNAAMNWTRTAEVKDPLGGEPMVVSKYFADRPQQIIGTMDRSGSMRHGNDLDVKLPKGDKLADRLGEMLDRMQQAAPKSISDEALKNTEQFHKAMGESLKLVSTGAEPDAIYFDEDGDLATVVERLGEHGEVALTTVKISPATPWSPQIQMNLDGKWFREVPLLNEKGEKVKNGKFNVYTREIFKKESDVPTSLRMGAMKYGKMRALISLRDLMLNQIELEVSRASNEQMEGNRAKLRGAYEAFVKEYGFISEQKNASIVSDMPDEGLLMSLETSYRPAITEAKAKSTGMAKSPASAKQSAILSRPVAVPPVTKTAADTAVDALAISMSESGRIDIDRIAGLRGLDKDAATKELTEGDSPLAFIDPENGNELVEKNAYLSGNVRRKLEAAKAAGLDANTKALEAVQPAPWSSDKVTAKPGANWIPESVYSDFLATLADGKASVHYAKITNTFEATCSEQSGAAMTRWGTGRVSLPTLFTHILNSSKIAVYDYDSDGKRHFNQTETDLAQEKAREIKEEFDSWIFKDGDRREQLTKLFNDTFNTRVTPQYDGSHLTFPGKVPDEIIQLRRGQVNAVWRGIIDDAVLYDHAVGAGKTFTGIARAMERRRMGMSKKPMIVVPNHMVSEWATQAYRLYPGARILAATKKDLESKNRRRLFAKIASGDWDMVIIPHSSFQFVSISPETEEAILGEEMALAQTALEEAEADSDPGARFKTLSVKEAEALIEKIQKRLDSVRGNLDKDRLLTFEQMGVDDLSIDESHEFKNLFYSSRLTDVRGMGNKTGSNKAYDLYTKTRVVRSMGGSLAFLTGTPISNSAVELYTILRYLAPNTLTETGFEHFDAFRSQYVDATAKFEPTDSGGGLKLVTRLGRSWSNMRSLMELYYSVADVVTNDDIKRWYAEDNNGKEFPLPKVDGGDRRAVSIKPTPTQLRILEETIQAFDQLPFIDDVQERNAERLRLMDRARKLSMHAKAVDPSLDDEPGGKLDVVADEAARIYKKWDAEKGTQLIFCDRSIPKSKGDDKIIKEYDELRASMGAALAAGNEKEVSKLNDRLEKYDPNEMEELRAAQKSPWSAYQHIKDRLVASGVPANEIAFIQNFNGDAAKEQLFQAVRDGEVRILIGSSPRMGAGTNVQDRLVALHHVDATWKPSDIEQREGRIIRQGNLFATEPTEDKPNKLYRPDFSVEILAYVTERTVDAKLWDLNATKLRMINAIRYYDGAFEMEFDDEKAVGMAEIAAIASGDPLLLERFRLSSEIDNLYRAKRSHRRRIEAAEDALRSAERAVARAPAAIAEYKEDDALREAFERAAMDDAATRFITISGKEFPFAKASLARIELATILGVVGDDEKVSVNINGKVYTSKGAAEEALTLTLGDVDPFVAEVDGKKIIRRSDFARAIREKVGTAIADGQVIAPIEIGTISGLPVKFLTQKSWRGMDAFLGYESTYEATGGRLSHTSYRDITPEKHKQGDPIPLTVTGLRPLISEFEKRIYSLFDGSKQIEEIANRAKEDIPGLIPQTQEVFKRQEELDEKEARLKEVEAELNGRTAKVADDSLPLFDPKATKFGTLRELWSLSPTDSDKNADRYFYLTKGSLPWFGHPDNGFATKEEAQSWADSEVERQNNGGDAAPSVLRKSKRANAVEFPGGIDAPAADALVTRLIESLGATASHQTVQSFFDLPAEVQAQARAQKSDEHNTKGVLHNGTIYIVANNAKSIKDIQETVFHELIGHVGMRKLLGPEFVQKTNALFMQLGGLDGLSKIAAENDFGPIFADYVRDIAAARQSTPEKFTKAICSFILTEEVFAHMAEKQPTIYQKAKALIGWVRDWLRRHGFAQLAEYGETDVLHLLHGARAALRGPNGSGPKGGVTPAVMSRDLHTLVGDEYDKGLEFASEFLNELSYEDAAFRYPVSTSLTLEGNLAAAYPGVEYLGEDTRPDEFGESKADRRFVFALPDGKLFYVYERGNEVWIDVSRLLPGDRGGAVYHGVANYAYNTGMVFAGDPNGLSEDAIVRRTSAMLSSALRFGTTAHLDASKEQIKGMAEKGIEPLDWQGNDVAKTKALLHTYLTTLHNQYPGIKNARYDFTKQQFVDRNGLPIRRGDGAGTFVAAGNSPQGRAARAGEASLRRGVLIQSLASSESGERPGILELVLSRSAQLVSTEDSLAAVFRRGPVESFTDYVTTPEGRKSITESIASIFSKSDVKTFNWFHRHIGTQFHKAKIDRDFGRVFDKAQSFIDDVARFGAESADMAPGILPKMDTIGGAIREALHYKRDKEDAKAIAAPIFEGTLFEDEEGNTGKVWTDSELRTRFALNERQVGLYRQFRRAVDHSLEALGVAEINKTAKVNELEMPDADMGIRELSDFYAAQFGNTLRDLKDKLERLKQDATGDNEALWQNAVKLGKGREAYHEALMKKKADEEAQQNSLMKEIETYQAMWDGIVGKKNTILKLQREGYAPLMRFGKFTVDVVEQVPALDKDGKQVIDKVTGEVKMKDNRLFFGMFETEKAAKDAAAALAEEYPQATVTNGVASQEGHQLFGAVSQDSLEMVARLAGKEDEAVQKFYKEAVSSRSALKRLIHRQGIDGYSEDVTRTLASFVLSNARATASAKHFGDLIEAAADIPKEKGDVKDEAVRLINYIRNPNEEAGALRGLLFMQFLGGSVASAAVNLTQTITTTMPYLAQFGANPGDLFSAAKLARKRFGNVETTGDATLDAALTRAEAEGVVSPHNVHALMGETRAQGAMRHRGIRLMSHMWGSFFSMAEQFNRETAFIAAFQQAEKMGPSGRLAAYEKQSKLNQSRGLPAPDWKLFANSFEFAKNAVNETQFVLSKAARPNWARGAVGATLFTFKQFAVFYLELMKRLPNRERALMLGTLILLAGVGGAPGADDLDDLIDTVGQAFGYDTNSARSKREILENLLGKAGGEFVLNGVSAFLPLDLSNRLGMGNLAPASGGLKKSGSDNRDRDMLELLGPAGGYYKQLTDAWDYALQGRYGMAFSQGFAPKAIKDVVKGYDMARSGTYDDTHGRRVTDASTLDALIKALGFQPIDVAKVQARKGEMMQDVALVRAVKSSLAEIWAQGVHDKDKEKSKNAQAMMAEWNRKNPNSAFKIKLSQVLQRANAMSKSAAERFVKSTPKEMRARVSDALATAE